MVGKLQSYYFCGVEQRRNDYDNCFTLRLHAAGDVIRVEDIVFFLERLVNKG